MADRFSGIEQAGGWWQLRRSYDGPDNGPGGFVLVVKAKDGKNAEYRGPDMDELIKFGTRFCEAHRPVRRVKKPPKKRTR